MIFSDATYQQWMHFLLILMRCSSLIAFLPFFGSPNIPATVKVGLSLGLAVFLFPLVKIDPAIFPTGLDQFLLLAVGEVLIGGIMALTVRLMLTAVQIMGQFAGFQMGFAVANVIDPMGGGQVSVVGQFCYIVALLTFFTVGGHHWFFLAMADSFKIVPPGDFNFSQILFDQIMSIAGDMFMVAVKIGAPVMGALLATSVTMGILAKTVPQMNILIVGMPLKIAVGLFFLSLTLGFLVSTMGDQFLGLGTVLGGLLKAM